MRSLDELRCEGTVASYPIRVKTSVLTKVPGYVHQTLGFHFHVFESRSLGVFDMEFNGLAPEKKMVFTEQ